MEQISRPSEPNGPLYRQVADRVAGLIEGGTLRPGERIPSVRKLSGQLSVSVTTVLEAYRLLEDRGLVEPRPQSGFYVKFAPRQAPPRPAKTLSAPASTSLDMSDFVMRILKEAGRRDLISFGAATPSPALFPVARLNRTLARVARNHPEVAHGYDILPGREDLRIQIARRALEAGCSLSPDEFLVTSGAMEAIHLCLRAVTKPGDTVAVETPTYYGLLEALETNNLRALEIATDPDEGVCLDELARALEEQKVAACAFAPSFGNPLGHCMPDRNKKRLVEMLARRGVPLIEDDIYGDLPFTPPRPKAAKSYDREGNVLLCSSFSKTLAPGYRVGWTSPGRHWKAVERLKYCTSIATATPTQMALAAFLESGGFEVYLRRLRRAYRDLVDVVSRTIGESFPDGTKATRPRGGNLLWVELPAGVDSVELHERALAEGMSIAPGPLFSPRGGYRNFIRLNCAIPWNDRTEGALRRLGGLVGEALERTAG